MRRIVSHLRAHPHLIASALVGVAVTILFPDTYSLVTKSLLGWNVSVWLYLALIGWMMFRADRARVRRVAVAQAEGTVTVLAVVIFATLVSLAGIVVELSAAKVPGAPYALPHLAFALMTVAGSWLLVPTMFTLTYASLYFRTSHGGGFAFSQCR